MKRFTMLFVCLLLAGPAVAAEKKRPMQVEDLFRFKRVADPQISPDGKTVVYVLTAVDLAKNRSSANLWLASTRGGAPRQLTRTDKSDRHPRWSPDGRQILFESSRSGESQLWVISIEGGEARQLTTLASEASGGLWSPDGKSVAFVSAVYPEDSAKPYAESNALFKKRKDEAASNPVKARIFTRLFFRHWNEYVEDKRQHLFVMPADGGEPRDVTPGDRDANPTSSTFAVGDDFTFSPDGKYLLFTAPPGRDEAWSTNYDICRVPISGATQPWQNLTKDNPAADGTPRFPVKNRLAYRRQKRAGFEADRWELVVVECDASGAIRGREPTVWSPPRWDASVDEFAVGPTASSGEAYSFVVTADYRGKRPLFVLPNGADAIQASVGVSGAFGSLTTSRIDHGRHCACTVARLDAPAEVYVTHLIAALDGEEGKSTVQLTHHNDALLAQLDLPRPESVTVKGAGGTPMQMWVLKPPGFDPKKKWPLVYLVHGGPQGAWEDAWSYRWNPELWAAQGYVVALPNPRGSTGFGQKYTDEISSDWGGKCYEDLMAGLAWLEKQPYIDTQRMAAAGASFGGYMMNWFQGHTTKFKTLITHCGVYNFDSMYGLTEELWFDEWEHGGPPWLNRASYEKFSPHRFAKNFKTPMLIIHNDLDFRVPVAEGLQLFTTLQRLRVPSRMINFPDEGHWVQKPQNSRYWHREVFAWLTKYAPPGAR